MHAPAQRSDIERLTKPAATIRIAAEALTQACPAVEAATTLGQALRTNASVLIGRHPTALWRQDVHFVLFRLGSSLSDSGLVAEAGCGRRSRHGGSNPRRRPEGRTALLGPDHPGVLTTREQLARWWGGAGDPTSAVAAFEDLLVDLVRVLGPAHPDAITAKNDAGYWRAGRFVPADSTTSRRRSPGESVSRHRRGPQRAPITISWSWAATIASARFGAVTST
jgi:hypothetical protein